MVFWHFCCILCVHYLSMRSTCVLNYNMPYLQACTPCIFVIYVVTRTSMETRLHDVAVFRDLGFCCHFLLLFFMPCKLEATVISMLILRYFSKDVLNIWLCSIHLCPCLQLCSSIAYHFLALLFL